MYTKEEAKAIRIGFWQGFKSYCRKKRIDRRWVLTGVKIKSVQLKFFADDRKALVMFQIDHKNDLRRFEIYECFLAYRKLFAGVCGSELIWEEEYEGVEKDRRVSAIFFELPGVSLYNAGDWEKIYAFFVEKMPLLEELYFEYRDLINARLKDC
ncbi:MULTISPECIES: DUF4268 domain-containing protein [Sanguibacteroides]|uniref:DUF4268 domain-containing protein n=1 Tax=Sanguibacteroides TaxID=1635148 RepID=UPI000D9E6B84|nr:MULTISPECIES: DUF4268 domain-containing protein [Sanguibacteroides]PXZ44335.1 DUF4268 domain-containing protein [Sanguibacteroides justesenii]